MLVHRRVTPSILPVPIYTPGWREALWEWSVLPKNTTHYVPSQDPNPDHSIGSQALYTMRPLRLPNWTTVAFTKHCQIGKCKKWRSKTPVWKYTTTWTQTSAKNHRPTTFKITCHVIATRHVLIVFAFFTAHSVNFNFIFLSSIRSTDY